MSECDRDETISSPFSTSQSHTVLLENAEAILFPSGENTTNNTDLQCPLRGAPMESPFSASQSHTVLSEDAEAILFPSGKNTTDNTQPQCPSRGAPMGSPFFTSQSRTILLEDAEVIFFPSGENTTDLTLSQCPSKTWRDFVHKYALNITLGRDWICWLYNMYIGDVSGLIARAE